MLISYAVANASAWTLGTRLSPVRLLAGYGLAGCLVLAFSLAPSSVLTGAGVLAAGATLYAVRARSGRGRERVRARSGRGRERVRARSGRVRGR